MEWYNNSMENKIAEILIRKGLTISTAESCTGGLLSSKLTDISGSSSYITLNIVTYANEAKHRLLNVSLEILEKKGAVSEECALEMAKGLHKLTGSDICVSTTGIAGPTGGSKDKPVGLMYSAIYTEQKQQVYKILLSPNIDRVIMKEKFTEAVLNNIYTFLAFV